MRNKKGFLLGEETLKIIVAILCILLLIFLAYSLYSSFNSNRNLEVAQANLDKIVEGMKVADKEGKFETILVEPKDWIIFSNSINPENLKPNEQEICYTKKYCLCICGGSSMGIHRCGDKTKTVCRAFDEKIEFQSNGNEALFFEIKPTQISIEKKDGGYVIKSLK